jgi:hypothetical protein
MTSAKREANPVIDSFEYAWCLIAMCGTWLAAWYALCHRSVNRGQFTA